MTVYSNPKYYKGPKLQRKRRLAKDSQTWQAGQFGRITDSGVIVATSNARGVNCLFATTQASSTSTSTVLVDDIPAGGTWFKIGITNASADTKALTTYIGQNYGVAVNSCVCTMSTGGDTNTILHVEDIIGNVTSNRNNDTSDVPGWALVSIVEADRTEVA